MVVKLREDVAGCEQAFVVSDAAGHPLGYAQTFKDGSAGYWVEPMQQARPARRLDDAVDRLVERFFPLRVVSVDEKGDKHDSDTFASSTAYTECREFAGAMLKTAKKTGGALPFGDANLGMRVKRQIVRVQVLGNDGTVIDDDAV
jgi:hypothetical protein